jgi:hypothetical protein
MNRGNADGPPGSLAFRFQQRPLEGDCPLLIERAKILAAGISFQPVNGVPSLLCRLGRPLFSLLQPNQIVTLQAIVSRIRSGSVHGFCLSFAPEYT